MVLKFTWKRKQPSLAKTILNVSLEYAVQSQTLLQSCSNQSVPQCGTGRREDTHTTSSVNGPDTNLSVCVLSCLTMTMWTVVREAPLSTGLSQQEHPSGMLYFLQGIFLAQGWNPHLMWLPHCEGYSTTEPLGKPPEPKYLWLNTLTTLPRLFVGKEQLLLQMDTHAVNEAGPLPYTIHKD